MKTYDIIIIGGGVTAFGAAMYAGRLGLKTLVIGETTGGTIILTDIVENYPGFKKLTGQELSDNIRNHALEYKIETLEAKVEKLKKEKDCFKVGISGKTFSAKTILLATGTKVKKINAPGEEELANNGVHYCALCDGPIYKNKIVAVIGGSDSAAKEALFLAEHAKKVYIIYRGDKIRPEPINLERIKKNKKIEIIYNTEVKRFIGEKKLESVYLNRVYKKNNNLKLDAVFVAIGHIPLSELAKHIGVNLSTSGEIPINRKSETNIPGFYAAGDVTNTEFKQAITGVAEGVTATYHAYKYINEHGLVCPSNDEIW